MVFFISVFCPSQDMFWRFCNAEWADKQIAPDTVHVLAKEAARKYVAQNIEWYSDMWRWEVGIQISATGIFFWV